MTQTFGQLGSGSGLTRRVGRGASTQALPHRLLDGLRPSNGAGLLRVCASLSLALQKRAPATRDVRHARHICQPSCRSQDAEFLRGAAHRRRNEP